MIQFDHPKQKSSIIKVLGVGGGGSNAVNYMFDQNIDGVDFIICNTDAKAIDLSKIPNKIQLGPHLTQGLGAGANPEVGKKATEESLDEIKSILEVNTKMAFITVGMGGGTGTGGAPIIAQICKELGILTVGIVTTPFGFEGPRRLQQAEEGIKALKPYVDTLLVISNDKLRMQYGNLKMREAFAKADNVLATAAKCITDVINSRGHIIVDFADVCTVMKNGGVAILGKSEVEGENRAQLAIEEALSSPLLNDSDIKGAKWILINIYSAEGEHECTMDEIETINNYLRMQAGEGADVIVGTGIDASLDKKIGITLIATGFEHKDPFTKSEEVKQPEIKEEKIVMKLTVGNEPANSQPDLFSAHQAAPTKVEASTSCDTAISNELMPTLSVTNAEAQQTTDESESMVLHFELSNEITGPVNNVDPFLDDTKNVAADRTQNFTATDNSTSVLNKGFLSKPANIYDEEINAPQKDIPNFIAEEEQEVPLYNMQIIEKEEAEPAIVEKMDTAQHPASYFSGAIYNDETEDKKRKTAERIQKLRNLSYNTNEVNSEFDSIPAYVRRNMDLFGNTMSSVENFYSMYTVGKEDNSQSPISSINTFLDGKKPD
jgi:cell division protein FtsZ